MAVIKQMAVIHIFNHVKANETPRDLSLFWQDKSKNLDDFPSIGPKVKHEKIGIKTNPGYFGNKSQNVFSHPTEQIIIIRAWKKYDFSIQNGWKCSTQLLAYKN